MWFEVEHKVQEGKWVGNESREELGGQITGEYISGHVKFRVLPQGKYISNHYAC